MTDPGRILITGSAGRIGQACVQALAGEVVRGFDRVLTPGATELVTGDIADMDAVRRAVQGVGTVIHLAATPDDDDFMTRLLPNNIVGTYNVMEAAQQAGVRRMILASSGQVVWYQRFTGPLPIRTDSEPTPRYWYACAKMFLEGAGRAFAEKFGQSVIVVRLGWCPRTPEHVQELRATPWGPDVYLSPADAGRFFACAVRAPDDLRFAVVYAVSKPVTSSPYDPEPARRLLGYEPQHRWPEGIEDMAESAPQANLTE
jgi:nucleoside-diphosphate-sugar epimerase